MQGFAAYCDKSAENGAANNAISGVHSLSQEQLLQKLEFSETGAVRSVDGDSLGPSLPEYLFWPTHYPTDRPTSSYHIKIVDFGESFQDNGIPKAHFYCRSSTGGDIRRSAGLSSRSMEYGLSGQFDPLKTWSSLLQVRSMTIAHLNAHSRNGFPSSLLAFITGY